MALLTRPAVPRILGLEGLKLEGLKPAGVRGTLTARERVSEGK